MTLKVSKFKLHRSLKKAIQRFQQSPNCEIRIDTSFEAVIAACATIARNGQLATPKMTWILPDMVKAYVAMHRSGFAHSVEVWIGGQLAGGLYCVAIGKAVFGESMFTKVPNASKIALAALVSFCRVHNIDSIDCQQNTRHLASLGAVEVPRVEFIDQLRNALVKPAPHWQFNSLDWQKLLHPIDLAT
jgi:leucyl/phenylalanyl-tRNA--protein transferase